jgi:hypothetical protein
MQQTMGPLGGARVVRHHDDGFLQSALQFHERVENLTGGLAVEVAGGLPRRRA